MQSYEKLLIFANVERLFFGIFCGAKQGSKYRGYNMLIINTTLGWGSNCKICVCRQKAVILHRLSQKILLIIKFYQYEQTIIFLGVFLSFSKNLYADKFGMVFAN